MRPERNTDKRYKHVSHFWTTVFFVVRNFVCHSNSSNCWDKHGSPFTVWHYVVTGFIGLFCDFDSRVIYRMNMLIWIQVQGINTSWYLANTNRQFTEYMMCRIQNETKLNGDKNNKLNRAGNIRWHSHVTDKCETFVFSMGKNYRNNVETSTEACLRPQLSQLTMLSHTENMFDNRINFIFTEDCWFPSP